MKQFNPTVCLEQVAQHLDIQAGDFIKLTTDKEEHITRTLIITAGNGAFHPRKIEIEGAENYENENLHYFINNLERFRHKKVMICGGGDSAVDWALMLEPIAEKVILVHRREKFRAHEHSVKQLHASSVSIKTPYIPVEFINNDNRIHQVVLEKRGENSKEAIEVDEVIVNYGFVSSLGSIKNWGLEIEKNSIVVNSRMETNIPGVYAAGDVCTFDGKVKLIATGLGEAPTAVNNAKSYLDPKAKVQPLHSTSIFA